MQEQFDLYALKGQAQRLRSGLEALGKPVSQSQALDLVAHMQGKRNWKELSGLTKAAELVTMQQVTNNQTWLERLFFVLRLNGLGYEDFDELVHEVIGGEQASRVNNQGLSTQLEALFEAFDFNRKDLVAYLEEQLERELPMPEGTATKAVIPASLMTCYGFPEEAEHEFDAFDWALQASASDLARVVQGNYRNCDATDEIGLWMATSAPNLEERKRVHDLLEGMRAIINIKPDRTGITLDVDADSFSMFVWLRHYYYAYVFEDSLLDQLGIDED